MIYVFKHHVDQPLGLEGRDTRMYTEQSPEATAAVQARHNGGLACGTERNVVLPTFFTSLGHAMERNCLYVLDGVSLSSFGITGLLSVCFVLFFCFLNGIIGSSL